MSAAALRFVHASDLHLESPLTGLFDVPDHLREMLIDAPYQAAQRVFETAVLENVDFLLLAGDVLDSRRAGPRAIAFLRDQFELLDQQGIAVYWIGGEAESNGRWPDTVRLPDGVHLFGAGNVGEVSHLRHENEVATIAGRSWDGRREIRAHDLRGDRGGEHHIAIAYGHVTEEAVNEHYATYWALGGDHNRRVLSKPPIAAGYCGAPQGRSPSESGPHGCQVVTIAGGEVRTSFAPTDAVRWRQERLAAKENDTLDDLHARLNERLTQIVDKEPGQTMLIEWRIEANEAVARQLHRQHVQKGLLDELRKEFGMGKTVAWSAELLLTPPEEVAADRFHEDTILGDFLRSAHELFHNSHRSLPVERLLGDDDLSARCVELLDIDDEEARRQALQDATLLGLDLLTGEEAA